MKKQLKGIAVIIFGVLLGVASISIGLNYGSDYCALFCLASIITGIVGIAITYAKNGDE